MKKHIYLITILFLALSCKKDLELTNPNSLSLVTFWKTADDFNSAFAATYKVFHDVNNGYFGVRGIETTNGRGDDFFIRNDVSDLYQLSTFTNTATTGVPASMFTGFYTAIFRANQIIENAQTASISDSLKKQFTAEAKFLRGINYFYLVINFGAAPLITSVPKSTAEYYKKEASEDSLWLQVASDLTVAKAGLPVAYPSQWTGRATRGAAIGYLGKAYLYQKKWTEAIAEFALLAKADGLPQTPFSYDLLANYEDNFLASKDNNTESLFEIQNQNVGGTQPWAGENSNEALGVTTAQEFAPTEVSGWFEAFATEKIFQEFQKEKNDTGGLDPRMYASLVWDYPGAMYYNKAFSTFSLPYGYKSRIRKYQNWRNDNEGLWISEINEKCLRYADILLMYAEALTMQGNTTNAYPFINRVRNRAKLVNLTTGYTADQMMIEIRHQRMIEFFREGQRFYDLKRWALVEQEITNSDKVGKENIKAKFYYFPIPQNEINTNPNITQNPAWE